MLFRNLRDEIDATLARDPAARSRLEVVLCYPGFHALMFHCLAHWLWEHRWLLAGRFVSHIGRMLTGIEIHPGATIGRRLFIDNCAACHGREGHGNPLLGAPDLGDQDWIYGGDGQAILTSIRDGRHGIMPPFGATFDAKAVENLANYVLGLSGSPHDEAKAAAGQPLFTVCAACHGSDGKGNALIGAPNLTDRTWLYGGTQATIEQTIREGRTGVMPAWRARLGDDGVKFVAAWVYAQSHAKAQAQSQSDAK